LVPAAFYLSKSHHQQRTLTAGFPDGVKTRSATAQRGTSRCDPANRSIRKAMRPLAFCGVGDKKKIHSDQRRPAYLAARVNEAKDVLRRHHRRLRTRLHLSNASPTRMVLARAVTFSTIIEAFD
jgi:hypothetical protein